jgi:type I restriction-modification system DNA methylase subunit
MAETLESSVREVLRNYVREVKSLPNESAKRSRFASLIAELFPGSTAINEYARGVEKLIRIERSSGVKKGRADAYYGNAVIEFEKSLSATLDEAKHQLCEYVAGTWQKEKFPRPMLAVASDGIRWIVYRPVLPAGEEPDPENILLDELRDFKVAEDSLGAFWLWLTSFLFRPQQVDPTAERFQLDFGSWSPLYREGMASLKKAWRKVSGGSEAKLAFDTWQRYLTVTYGRLTEDTTTAKDKETAEEVSELENLFLRHTYLASIARLLIWAALSQGKSADDLRQIAKDVLSGRYFKSKRLANLVDDDFFHWIRHENAEKTLAPTWERVLSQLTEYDLSMIREDVLKGVYQQLIDPKDRHDLGEYYTPDWLCERIVNEMLPKHGYKAVLDPSCGSGSFLRAAITHFLRRNETGTENERLREILKNVQGIDIHPVAVTIARATYVLALGKLVSAARKPINIPVYMADSLFLPREVEESLFEKITGVEITFGGKKDERQVVIPNMLIHSPELFDDAIAACTEIAKEHAQSKKDTRKTMEKYLSVNVPDLSQLLEYDKILDALWTFTESLAELIREKKNSIWSFIIRNSFRPAMLKQQFEYIIGNPPWLSYRYISDLEYQREVKSRAVERYQIAPKSQKLMTQMELATVFLAHSMATFANAHCRLAFVMPRGVLSADQHQNLILRKYHSTAKFKLTGYWDLWDVSPLFNVPSCVFFAERSLLPGSPKEKVPVLEWKGTLPSRDVPWQVAKTRLESSEKVGRVIYLGSRAALSTAPGSISPTKPSKYQEVFKNGATIYPRSFYFVRVNDLEDAPDLHKQYWAETDPEQAADAKKPYDEIHLSGMIEGQFLFQSAVSKHILPFVNLHPAWVALPLKEKNGVLSMVTRDNLMKEGFREFGKWMAEVEKLWTAGRGEKADNETVYGWLDYQGKLTAQNLHHRHLVLYNAAGTNVSAAYFDRHLYPRFVVDHKLYWAAFSNVREAHYVAAMLNSETANQMIKPFQSTGLLGERDIHKKLLDLPFPSFNEENPKHNALADIGICAWKKAREVVSSAEFPTGTSTARQRGLIRTNLESELGQIDKLVKQLFA